MKKIKPLGEHVLVKRNEPKTQKGGIFLPDSAKEKPREGEVVAVGTGKLEENGQRRPMKVKVGDKVLFGAYAGTEIKGEDNLLIIGEDEILALVQ